VSFLPHAHVWVALILAVSILLMLIRARGIPEVYWIAGGVVLLLLLRLEPFTDALHAAAKGRDVYFFLMGMMLLSELAAKHGVFDWMSSAAVRHANGSMSRLFLLVYVAGTMVTIFMSNDATAVVLTPAILVAVRKARIEPLPYLFVCAFIANAASFVLPISNPANLVVFQQQMPPLGEWLLRFGAPSIVSIVVTYAVLRWYFRRELRSPIESPIQNHLLDHHGKVMLAGLAATAVVLLIAAAMNRELGLPTCLTALAFTAIVSLTSRSNPLPVFREISWSTLFLVAGLFVMVDAVERIGVMEHTRAWLTWLETRSAASCALLAGFVVGIANNLVNNLPLGLIVGSTLRPTHGKGLIASAVLIGVDLGPNLSITGSLATILWLIALRKEKLHVGFWSFLKIGAIAMPVALFFSLIAAIAVHLSFGIRSAAPPLPFLNGYSSNSRKATVSDGWRSLIMKELCSSSLPRVRFRISFQFVDGSPQPSSQSALQFFFSAPFVERIDRLTAVGQFDMPAGEARLLPVARNKLNQRTLRAGVPFVVVVQIDARWGILKHKVRSPGEARTLPVAPLVQEMQFGPQNLDQLLPVLHV
jgi:arsenical pump membrane protein